jgi:hypothetical protein
MAREKKRKGKTRKGAATKSRAPNKRLDVHLAPTVEVVHKHVTQALCDEVFGDMRRSERQRRWSLFALARFWLAVILEPPPALGDLLERTRRLDPRGLLPHVEASAQAFFARAKTLSRVFFAEIFSRFVAAILPTAPKRYCPQLAHLDDKFAQILVFDGSRLDKIAHRLKILWDEKAAVLPGCLLATYDLRRGFATQLCFEADAASSEFQRAMLTSECLDPNTLVLGDRLYCAPKLFHALAEQECFAVVRRTKSVKIQIQGRLSRARDNGSLLEDLLVTAGTGKDAVELRLVRLKRAGRTYEALTNVLDPERLSAQDVVVLYPLRWRVERLFHQLKVVLNLKKFYCANPNAVAEQVYAGALVHAAFRVAQAEIAEQVDLDPEELSPDKLFPRLALASIKVIEAEFYFELMQRANPQVKLRKPSWRGIPDTVVSLGRILVQRRSSTRRKREYDKARASWKSIAAVDGGEELT